MFGKIFGRGLNVGESAPDFVARDQAGQSHRLSQYSGKWVVLYFYPKDHTFGCTKEACSFRDESSSLQAQILGVSLDSTESHKGFADKYHLNFPLLSDSEGQISRSFEVMTPLGLPNRVTFIIDPKGVIRDKIEWANWLTYGKTVAERLSKLQAQ